MKIIQLKDEKVVFIEQQQQWNSGYERVKQRSTKSHRKVCVLKIEETHISSGMLCAENLLNQMFWSAKMGGVWKFHTQYKYYRCRVNYYCCIRKISKRYKAISKVLKNVLNSVFTSKENSYVIWESGEFFSKLIIKRGN